MSCPDIYMHINYFEQGYPLEIAFERARDIGFDGIEVRDRDRSGVLNHSDYLAKVSQLAKEYSLKLTYGCRVHTTAETAAEREESAQLFFAVIDQAAQQGVGFLNVFAGGLYLPGKTHSQVGSAIAKPEDYAEAARMIGAGARRAAQHGIRLCLETHNGYIHDCAQPTAALIEQIQCENVGVNFDYGNIILNQKGESLEQALDILQPYIGYVHLKNCIPLPEIREGYHIRTPMADGEINHEHYFKMLLSQGYAGALCIENTMKADKFPIAISDLRYVRETWQRAEALAASCESTRKNR